MIIPRKDERLKFEEDGKIKQTLPYYDEFYKQVIELIKTLYNSAVRWLDIGCGTGKMGSIVFENIELENLFFVILLMK